MTTSLTPGPERPSLGGYRARPLLKPIGSEPTSPLISPPLSSKMLARKTSYQQLTQNSLAAIPDVSAGYGVRQASAKSGGELEVGDLVNTPGGMHGTVKFIGNVKNKQGVFVGVELEGDLAGRGKNDGAVDGVRYFTTAQSMSGIFVPLARASKRSSAESSPPPPTPTLSELNSPTGSSSLIPPSLTPGRRPESPANRAFNTAMKTPGRPSYTNRPESPVRRLVTPGPRSGLQPPITPRNVSTSASRIGALSPTPGMQYRMRSESTGPDGRPGTANGGRRLAPVPKAQYGVNLKQPKSATHLRSGSSLGARPGSSLDRRLDDEGSSPTDSGAGTSRMSKNEEPDHASLHELNTLKQQLAEKDKAFNEQAAALLEMETSITELQSLMQNAPNSPTSMTSPVRSNPFEDADVTQLRALLREKSERIQFLTAEFDAHRTDFRSTIDTLELASSETERVYEKRVDDLLAEIRELHERNDDVESVARQLKQLEELVAELEEGLEDARRGEAEARAEVEFLRGEVERCREELRREREKSAAAVANAAAGTLMRSGSDEVEKKDDEIRGLKAIIHSLSRDSVALDDASLSGVGLERNPPSQPTGGKRYPLDGPAELVKERQNSEKLQQDIMELQSQMQSKALREQELSREIEDLRKKKEARSSSSSEKTVTPWANGRVSGDPPRDWRSRAQASRPGSDQPPRPGNIDTTVNNRTPPPMKMAPALAPRTGDEDKEGDLTPVDSDADSSVPWCEICESAGHDILTCTNMFGTAAGGPASAGPNGITTASAAAAEEEHHSFPSPIISRRPSLALEGPSGTPPATSPAPPSSLEEGGMSLAEKKKSVHLPHLPLPSSTGMGDSFGPMPGKESGVVEMDKWCALCERDGHDSVDCPLEVEF